MIIDTLSFESENLRVDYISFNFKFLEDSKKKKIINCFYQLGFNVFEISKKYQKYNEKVPLCVRRTNEHEVLFIVDIPYWEGTKLDFSGSNAARFYYFLKKNLFPYQIISFGILNRFDIVYQRQQKVGDDISILKFLSYCHKKVSKSYRNCKLDKNKKGSCLKNGSRKSNIYSRIYQSKTKDCLRFEYEISNKSIQDYHNMLVENHFEEFEDRLTKKFISYFGKHFPLKYCYFDWLVIKLRSIQARPIRNNFLRTDYLVKNPVEYYNKQEQFILFLQILSFTEELSFTTDNLGSTNYLVFEFKIHDFLKFQNPDFKLTNYYQIKKFLEFLIDLQSNFSIRTFFSNVKFQSLIVVPKISIRKCQKHKCWLAKLWLAQDYYLYNHPFILPDLFKGKYKKDEFVVRFEVFKNFTYQENIEKKFLMEEFIQRYRGKISNQRITNLKKEFIKIIEILNKHNVIESDYKIISKGQSIIVNKLTIENISEGFIIYEKIKVNF